MGTVRRMGKCGLSTPNIYHHEPTILGGLIYAGPDGKIFTVGNHPKRVLSPLDSCFDPEVCSASIRALNDKQLDCQGICNIVTWKSSWKSGEHQFCDTVHGSEIRLTTPDF